MKVFNTLGRTVQTLTTRIPDKIGMYVCGPTVQAKPHLGHGRSGVAFDVIRRYLAWSGYDVTYVRNITDVDDKIIAVALDEGATMEELGLRYSKAFDDAYTSLNILPPDIEPKATEHIEEMHSIIATLIAKDLAYAAGGDVYFSVRSNEGYGKLSGRDIDDLQSGARIEPGDIKRDPLDFALWKGAKEGEPSWPSPWGLGRPGWHIECSAMAHKYLGTDFEIHGGGNDLIFPHHENEIAQSEAAFDAPFSRIWLHNGMLNLSGEKMSKSTGHVIDLTSAVEQYGGMAVRLFYLRTHYRRPLDFSQEALEDAAASIARIWAFIRRGSDLVPVAPDEDTLAAFRAAMDNDFDTAGGLAAMFDAVRAGNRLFDDGGDPSPLGAAVAVLLDVLGLAEPAATTTDIDDQLEALVSQYGAAENSVDGLLAVRIEARGNKDWAAADGIRDALADLGIVIEDSADGTRWHRG